MGDSRSSIKRRKCGDEIGGRVFDAIKLDWNCERSDRKFATVKLSHAVNRARERERVSEKKGFKGADANANAKANAKLSISETTD